MGLVEGFLVHLARNALQQIIFNGDEESATIYLLREH